jgi:hypothetical protein
MEEKPHQSWGGESPAPQVPEGRAWRGWLWIVVFLVLEEVIRRYRT